MAPPLPPHPFSRSGSAAAAPAAVGRAFTDRFFVPAALLLLVASVVAVYAIFWTTYQELRAGQGTVNVLAAEFAVRDAEQRLREVRQHVAQLEAVPAAERERLALALPRDPAEPELFVALEAIVVATGARLRSLTVSPNAAPSLAGRVAEPPPGAAPVSSVTAALAVTVADYESLGRLLEAVEQNLRLLDITSFSYQAESGEVQLHLAAYYLP